MNAEHVKALVGMIGYFSMSEREKAALDALRAELAEMNQPITDETLRAESAHE